MTLFYLYVAMREHNDEEFVNHQGPSLRSLPSFPPCRYIVYECLERRKQKKRRWIKSIFLSKTKNRLLWIIFDYFLPRDDYGNSIKSWNELKTPHRRSTYIDIFVTTTRALFSTSRIILTYVRSFVIGSNLNKKSIIGIIRMNAASIGCYGKG